jgi:hypothetical protein
MSGAAWSWAGWSVPYAGSGREYGTGVGATTAATTRVGVDGFPASLTSFIGRAGPVREVPGLLGQYRLVTVTGPGGRADGPQSAGDSSCRSAPVRG